MFSSIDMWLPAEYQPRKRLGRKRKKDGLVELGAMNKRLNRSILCSDSDEEMNAPDEKKPALIPKKEPRESKPSLKVKSEPRESKPSLKVKSEPRESKPSLKVKRESRDSKPTKFKQENPLFDMSNPSVMTTANLSPQDMRVVKLKQELVQKIVELSPFLPNNSLDELIDGLGGPSHVAEVRNKPYVGCELYLSLGGWWYTVVMLSDGYIPYYWNKRHD